MLANVTYQHTKVPQWTSMCIESCMKRLKDLNKPFKYIGELCARFPATAHTPHATPRRAKRGPVQQPPPPGPNARASTQMFGTRSRAPAVTAVLMQKNGAGLHTATSCYWDNTTDGAPLGCYRGAGRRSERVTCVRTGPKSAGSGVVLAALPDDHCPGSVAMWRLASVGARHSYLGKRAGGRVRPDPDRSHLC